MTTTNEKIIAALTATHKTLTAKEIAKAAKLGESTVREALKKGGLGLTTDDSVKPVRYQLVPASAKILPGDRPAAKAPKLKVVKVPSTVRVVEASAGRGVLKGKTVNDQNAIELRRAAVKAAGGQLFWVAKGRFWSVALGDKELEFASRDFATMSVGDLLKALGADVGKTVEIPRHLLPVAAGRKEPKSA